MTYSVGLTGSMASGKSTVAHMFASLGAELICSDTIARSLTAQNEPALQEIVEHFGPDILQKNGSLDRPQLRNRIFKNPEERLWLEQLLHPLIKLALKSKAEHTLNPYCIVEIPLLYQKKDFPWLNRILVTTTSEEIALKRIMQRDQCTIEQAKTIIDVQNAQINYLNLADDLLINNDGLECLNQRIQALHELYMRESQALSG